MKPQTLLLLLITALLAGAAGWFAGHRPAAPTATSAAGTGRKILYYQSAMHPWIKSDKPGKCTICGMDLAPIYEGDKGFQSGEGVVSLGSNIIQVINVQSSEVRRGLITRTLRVAGTLENDPTRRRVVSAYVDGRIDRLSANFVGAEVTAGQPLATVYSPMLLAAEREHAVLRHSMGAQPSADAQSLFAASTQRLRRMGLTDAQIEQLSSKSDSDSHTEVLAPLSGTVVERFVFEGQYVKEGDRLFDLADFSTMWFQFDAYERDLVWLRPGLQIDVTLPSVPGKVFAGTIAFIDPNLKDMTRSARVRVELANPLINSGGRPHRELSAQAYAEGAVRIESAEAVLVPRSAVLSPGGNPVAYVDRGGGAFEQRHLRLGRLGDQAWEVLEGVSPGEKVVTAGNLLIDAQAQLDITIASTPAPESTSTAPAGKASLTEPQRKVVGQILRLAVDLADALAADDVAKFNTRMSVESGLAAAIETAFPGSDPQHEALAAVRAVLPSVAAADLPAARKTFNAFSTAAVGLLRSARPLDVSLATLKIFRCPMTKRSFPGAPAQADWIQDKTPVRNPYFGADMIDCGTELK